ncbi:hypothetical protein, partial [Bacteroides uniformis]|uniref:hypothetical protein n=1 Tax=Bacteroides uniformis TaxID=820 RepID=UPI001E5ED0DE
TVNGYGGRQTKENEKSWCFKGWETLVNLSLCSQPYIDNRNEKKNHSFTIFADGVYLSECGTLQ